MRARLDRVRAGIAQVARNVFLPADLPALLHDVSELLGELVERVDQLEKAAHASKADTGAHDVPRL